MVVHSAEPMERAALGLLVRPAVPGDLEQVLAIEAASFADPWTEDAFQSSLDLPHFRFLVAERGSLDDAVNRESVSGGRVLAGYVLAMVLGPEGEIADIAVADSARQQGVGGALLDRMVSLMRDAGVQTLYLEVRESNAAARRLYESRDFRPVGRRRGYYEHPVEDALVLRRDLEPT